MTRALQSLSVFLLLSSLYLVLYLGLVPLNQTVQKEVIPVLPFYALIVFGCYLLGRLGVAIATFNDVPEAHDELQKEIVQAKAELRRGGVDVD
ncbi:Dolichyl-phosphate mannosyltransferase polypeptide 3 [Aspergillus sp. HF37]|nr:Dolichyl-phosphate mannosyltransferase polypeptide 3 [Aspergillus sp. HF37]